MPKLEVEVTNRILDLVKSGVISITAGFYKSGTEVKCRVNEPHAKLGVYPHDSLTLDEAQVLLEKVQVAQEGIAVPSASSSPFKGRPGRGTKVGCRSVPNIGAVPVTVTVNGVQNSLPQDSLTWKDLDLLSDDQLNRRLKYLGMTIGADKAVARITCGNLASPPSSSLKGWWEKASNEDRFKVVSNAKRVGTTPSNHEDLIARLTAGRYPFRDIDRPMEAQTDEEEEELTESFERGLALNWNDSE